MKLSEMVAELQRRAETDPRAARDLAAIHRLLLRAEDKIRRNMAGVPMARNA